MLDKFIGNLSSWLSARQALCRLKADRYWSTISTKCGTLATIPRIAGVAGRSITWFRRVNPRPLITRLCFSGAQIAERTHFRCNFPPPEFDFFAVISTSGAKGQRPMAGTHRLSAGRPISDRRPLALKFFRHLAAQAGHAL